jgi:outer membrane protein assembly factor BamB
MLLLEHLMRLAVAGLCALFVCALAHGPAETASPVLTKAPLPRREVLDRLGMKIHWQTYFPMGGTRDGILHMQVLGDQLVAQTRSGAVIALDAETGRRLWTSNLGEPYRVTQEPANANDQYVFVNSGARMVGLDRASGNPVWTITLPDIPATRADADNEFLYSNMVRGRMQSYRLPQVKELGSIQATGISKTQQETMAGQYNLRRAILRVPEPMWAYQGDSLLRVPPVVMPTHVIITDKAGRVFSLEKESRALAGEATVGPVTVPLGYDDRALYIGCEDFNVYAYEIVVGALERRWQFTAGGAILRQPEVMGPDLFVDVENRGLARLDKQAGKLHWRQPRAHRFLAASLGLVFALDSRGELLVLDRAKGAILGSWDVRDYALIVQNDVTDRLYLANHDGLIICLRDQSKEHDKPLMQNPRPKTATKPAKPTDPIRPMEGDKTTPMP